MYARNPFMGPSAAALTTFLMSSYFACRQRQDIIIKLSSSFKQCSWILTIKNMWAQQHLSLNNRAEGCGWQICWNSTRAVRLSSLLTFINFIYRPECNRQIGACYMWTITNLQNIYYKGQERLTGFSRRTVRSTTETLGVGTRKAIPVSLLSEQDDQESDTK